MKITLIRTSELVPGSSNALTTPPVGIAYLAAYLEANKHETQVIDGVGENIQNYSRFSSPMNDSFLHGLNLSEMVGHIHEDYSGLVGISCMFSQDWPVAKQLIERVKLSFPHSLIVCGGEHISALPEFSIRDSGEIDFCVIGEGEQPLLQLVDLIEAGRHRDIVALGKTHGIAFLSGEKFIQTKPFSRKQNLDDLPLPAWNKVPIDNYLDSESGFGVNKGRSMPIVGSRGCPYGCTFCSNPSMWNQQWIERDPIKVVDEIELYTKQYQAFNFDFYDLTAIIKKDWIMRFCREIERRRLAITYQLPSGTRSEAIDNEVAQYLNRTGCCHLVYAPESGSERLLKVINKRLKIDLLVQSMESAVKAGTFVKANIVIGFPDERGSDIIKTFIFILRIAVSGIHDIFIYTFTPYPGTQLFDRLTEEGKLSTPNDEYFYSLSSYTKLNEAHSYNSRFSNKLLNGMRWMGLIAFYVTSFSFHPLRIIKIISNLRSGRTDMRIEGFIQSLLPWSKGQRGMVYCRGKNTLKSMPS